MIPRRQILRLNSADKRMIWVFAAPTFGELEVAKALKSARYSTKSAARLLGITHDAVRTRLKNLRDRIRTAIDETRDGKYL